MGQWGRRDRKREQRGVREVQEGQEVREDQVVEDPLGMKVDQEENASDAVDRNVEEQKQEAGE